MANLIYLKLNQKVSKVELKKVEEKLEDEANQVTALVTIFAKIVTEKKNINTSIDGGCGVDFKIKARFLVRLDLIKIKNSIKEEFKS